MRKLLLILFATIIAKHSGFTQMQARLALPNKHVILIKPAVFNFDNQLALTASCDKNARI